jgi:N-acetylglucosaminyl-diphospho-decaprenol L-rhamnosyltransferase
MEDDRVRPGDLVNPNRVHCTQANVGKVRGGQKVVFWCARVELRDGEMNYIQSHSPECVTARARVLVVVVSRNDRQWLDPCLGSLASSSLPLDIVLVDNASSDGTADIIQTVFPRVKIVRNMTNRGFAGGCNQGLAIGVGSSYDYFFLVNPDTRCAQDLIARLVAFMDDHEQYGVVGPLQTCYTLGSRPQDKLNHWTQRALKDLNTFYFARWIPRLLREQPYPKATPGVVDRSYVQGSAFFMRRTVCEIAGLFDETFHTFHEEVDLCRRAWWSGFRVGLITDLRIEHCARDLSHCTWYRAFHRTKNRYYFLLTEPSLRASEISLLLWKWIYSDIGTALMSGRLMFKRLLVIPASAIWILWNSCKIRSARLVRAEGFRRSPWFGQELVHDIQPE